MRVDFKSDFILHGFALLLVDVLVDHHVSDRMSRRNIPSPTADPALSRYRRIMRSASK